MKLIGLTLVRNESEIIRDTLEHMAGYCDMIFVYDDCSTDDTAKICLHHPKVVKVIQGTQWSTDRTTAETRNRAELLRVAKQHASEDDWFIYLDADERVEYDFSRLKHMPANVTGIRMKLFDFYITPSDIDLCYDQRLYCGPEYRAILMVFRNLPGLQYSGIIQREVKINHPGKIIDEGYVRHYGKAISVKQWEETCTFYSTWFPPVYSVKWSKRKGKAVHTLSSFGKPLIKWEEKEKKGIPLTNEIQKHSIYDN